MIDTSSVIRQQERYKNPYFFIAVLLRSCYTYVKICTDMKLETWLNVHINNDYIISNGINKYSTPLIYSVKRLPLGERSIHSMRFSNKIALLCTRVRIPQNIILSEIPNICHWIIRNL